LATRSARTCSRDWFQVRARVSTAIGVEITGGSDDATDIVVVEGRTILGGRAYCSFHLLRTIEGIVSERDVVRALHTRGAELLGTQVREIMTVNVLTSSPGDEVRSLAKTMTEKRFRHMPVVVDDALAGIVTIGDIVKNRLDELETEHDQLVDYISSTG